MTSDVVPMSGLWPTDNFLTSFESLLPCEENPGAPRGLAGGFAGFTHGSAEGG